MGFQMKVDQLARNGLLSTLTYEMFSRESMRLWDRLWDRMKSEFKKIRKRLSFAPPCRGGSFLRLPV